MGDLIHKFDKIYKEAEIVLIKSKTSLARLQYDVDYHEITFLKERSVVDTQDYIGANLYITSDENPKNGDWYLATIHSMSGEEIVPQRFFVGSKPCCEIPLGRKIIATTDLLITDESITGKDISRGHAMMVREKDAYYKCLPQPSEEFINFFRKHFNVGNIIKKILLECVFKNNTTIKISYEPTVVVPNYVLKVSDDNTVSTDNFEYFKKEYTSEDMKRCYIEAVKHYKNFGIEPTGDLAQDYLNHLKNK